MNLFLTNTVQDIRYALRQLRKLPDFDSDGDCDIGAWHRSQYRDLYAECRESAAIPAGERPEATVPYRRYG